MPDVTTIDAPVNDAPFLADRGGLDLWAEVVGQRRAVADLRAVAHHPVHAYLLVGPRGSGKRALARAFGAEVLASGRSTRSTGRRVAGSPGPGDGGAGAQGSEAEPAVGEPAEDTGIDGAEALRLTEQVRREEHPDYLVVQRVGASISVEQAELVVREAARTPIEGATKVIVLDELNLAADGVAPKLLKSIEEPVDGVVFLVLADEVPPEMVTIASRCVRVDLGPVPNEVIVEQLVQEGVPRSTADDAAIGAAGDLRRARVLATDPQLAFRRQLWFDLPTRLDGTGHRAVRQVEELIAAIDNAAAPLEGRHAEELAALEARVAELGERGAGRRDLEARHKRELRRLRTDELRFGLAVLARRYRDEAATSDRPGPLLDAVGRISATNEGFIRNPVEKLQLQALFVQLPPL